MTHPYADILDHPRHVSKKHPPLSAASRAAQFSPFAALTGYDDTVREAARRTDEQITLDPDEVARIDAALRRLRPSDTVRLTFFVADERKAGGAYRQIEGTVKKLDALGSVLLLTDGTVLPFDDIYGIETPGTSADDDDGSLPEAPL